MDGKQKTNTKTLKAMHIGSSSRNNPLKMLKFTEKGVRKELCTKGLHPDLKGTSLEVGC